MNLNNAITPSVFCVYFCLSFKLIHYDILHHSFSKPACQKSPEDFDIVKPPIDVSKPPLPSCDVPNCLSKQTKRFATAFMVLNLFFKLLYTCPTCTTQIFVTLFQLSLAGNFCDFLPMASFSFLRSTPRFMMTAVFMFVVSYRVK